jgi:hypothetical protein
MRDEDEDFRPRGRKPEPEEDMVDHFARMTLHQAWKDLEDMGAAYDEDDYTFPKGKYIKPIGQDRGADEGPRRLRRSKR